MDTKLWALIYPATCKDVFIVKWRLFLSFNFQEENKKKQLKVKIQMAKFLQDTVEEMAVTAKQKKTQEVVSEFANFFEKVNNISLKVCCCDIKKESWIRFSIDLSY